MSVTLNPRQLGRVRGSSWGDFFDCGLRWYFKNVEGLRLPDRGVSTVGVAIHAGTAVFDRKRLVHEKPSVEEAVQAAYQRIADPKDEEDKPIEVAWASDDDDGLSKGEAIDFAVKLTTKYCLDVAPGLDYTAVEVRCTGLEVATEHGVVLLTGTADRVRRGPLGDLGVVDFKSGKKAVGTDNVAIVTGHHLQLGVYTLMAEAELKRPLTGDAMIVGLQTNSKLRVGSGIVAHPKRALVGDGDRLGMIEIAAKRLKEGDFPPNPKSMLCSQKWCPGWSRCPYHV